MFDDIIKYINTHPIIFILIIFLLLLVLYKLYTYNPEHFNDQINPVQINTILGNNASIAKGGVNNIGVQNPALPHSVDQATLNLNDQLLGDKNRLVRFRATINGKNFYLMISPISQCSNTINTQKDCTTNTVILIDENSAIQYINNYLGTMYDKEKVCNLQQLLQCNRKNSHIAQSIQSSQTVPNANINDLMPGQTISTCPEEHPACKFNKQTPIDFIVSLYNPFTNSNNNYLIQGISGPLNINTKNIRYYLNQNNNSDPSVVNVLCADAVNRYNPNIMIDLVTSKQTNDNNNILGYDSGLRTRIRFNIIASPSTLNPNTNRPITIPFYLGACRNNVCTLNGINYARACLFSNMLDPNVLEFEPIIINYN